MFGYDLGIDFGSQNLLISVPGKGIVLDEPSFVAVEQSKDKVIYSGKRAYYLDGREPENVTVHQPIIGGVVGDYSLCCQMLREFFNKVLGKSIFRPRAVASIPALTTDVEKRTIIGALISAGARSVCLIEEPLCSAFGSGIDPESPGGSFVINIGAGTTDMAVISQGAMNQMDSIKIAGNDFDNEIVKHIKDKYGIAIGVHTAQSIKNSVACAIPRSEDITTMMKGQDIKTGLPIEKEIGGNEIYECLKPMFFELATKASAMFERTSPQLIADITSKGVMLCGGCASIYGMDKMFSRVLGVPAEVVPNPEKVVVKGCETALKKMHIMDKYGYSFKTREDVRMH